MAASEEATSKNIPLMSSGELGKLLGDIATRQFKGWSEKSLVVRAYGVLGNLAAQRAASQKKHWAKIYGVTLDADGPLVFNAPSALMEHFDDGDMVEVAGYPVINVFQNRMTVQLELLSASAVESDEGRDQRRLAASNLATLQSLKPIRNPFPMSDTVSLTVIHSSASSALVHEDFFNGLAAQAQRCRIETVPVKISSADEIVQAVEDCEADILVIIRGGGDTSNFSVFNDRRVLDAISAFKGYRVMGIGHSANTTLVDLIADYAAPVPAAAGTHIRDQLTVINDLVGKFESALYQQNDLLAKLRERAAAARDDAEREIKRLRDSVQEHQANHKIDSALRGNKLLWLAIVLLLLVILVKW